MDIPGFIFKTVLLDLSVHLSPSPGRLRLLLHSRRFQDIFSFLAGTLVKHRHHQNTKSSYVDGNKHDWRQILEEKCGRLRFLPPSPTTWRILGGWGGGQNSTLPWTRGGFLPGESWTLRGDPPKHQKFIGKMINILSAVITGAACAAVNPVLPAGVLPLNVDVDGLVMKLPSLPLHTQPCS